FRDRLFPPSGRLIDPPRVVRHYLIRLQMGGRMKVTDVFTPTGVPTVTYVTPHNRDLERQLRDALATPGQIVSLSGPSKSGKTVLINKVISRDNLIAVSGAAIKDATVLWDRILNWMDAPS